MSEWIKCSDRMPTNEDTVLIYYRSHRRDEGKYAWHIATAFFDDSNYLYDVWMGWIEDPDDQAPGKIEIPLRFVTHWMPLPRKPHE